MAILIVDDEELIRRSLHRILARKYTVDDAGTVAEAREKLAAEHFELVLCDINLSAESGLDLVAAVCDDAPNTVVVMVTGLDNPKVAAQAMELGVYGYLVKPFTPNEILITVAGALRRRSLEVERIQLEAQQSELRVLADRERIGRELHDNVIQRLFAIGLGLARTSLLVAQDDARSRIETSIDEIDLTIRTIRTVIFDIESGRPKGLREAVVELVRESAGSLGFEPSVEFIGGVDTLIGDDVAEHLLATLRESISNVGRHASANRVDISIVVDGDIALTVRDDGVGIDALAGRGTGGSGVSIMGARADRLRGRLTLEPRPSGGTQLEWRVPLVVP